MLAERMNRLAPSLTLEISTKAKELMLKGVKVFDLSLGDPVLDPGYKLPEHIRKAAVDALDSKKICYTTMAGLLELRRAVVDAIKKNNGLEFKPEEVNIATGAKQILFNALLATVNKGDEVIIPCPAWVSYIDIVNFVGGKPVEVVASVDAGFKISPEQLEAAITPKTKWLMLNSPSNPTGAIYNKDELRGLADVMLRHKHVMIISDDIYQHIRFDQNEKYYNMLMVEPALRDRFLIVDGISKSHGMTGWRLGYGVCSNKKLIDAMVDLQSQSTASANALSQYAAIAAVGDDHGLAKAFSKEVAKKVDLFVSRITDDRVKINKPKGAFYVFSSIEGIVGKKWRGQGIDSCSTFCKLVLEHLHVAVTPGNAFGLCNHFRASLACSESDVIEAADLLNGFFKEVV